MSLDTFKGVAFTLIGSTIILWYVCHRYENRLVVQQNHNDSTYTSKCEKDSLREDFLLDSITHLKYLIPTKI